ncbi:NAD(P)-binding protein [Saccharothrix coeruleofusca]|uniref:2-polyprenyl-6-methoxyphenol hydroxylase-like FAD-dependent oxidoreductase n=1 Tax=Saccharothrix coeruleofusca TaxID=33919 RepID=A0A918ATG1_9PSEU|nr:NAD(P)-binding protein [Saccharothrix coeruleofusca]GGP81916.1 hypothetical protein GCM10010185_64930 [Saccharothrix coeruleofusca]
MAGAREAVVVGGGIGGLVAARVLADHFERVTLLEQDEVTADTEYHSGVPQARHPHALLARGAEVLERLFPGLGAELDRLGVPSGDQAQKTRLRMVTGWAPEGVLGLTIRCFTRVCLETCLRRRVLALPRVRLRAGARVDDLCFDEAGLRVTGVRVGSEVVAADFVVVAAGRHAKLRDRLAAAGFDVPEDLVVNGGLSYSTRLYHVPPGARRDWIATAQGTHAPVVRRGGAVFAVEADRWQICLIGSGGEPTPTDQDGFLAYARSLDNPLIAQCVEQGVPAGELYRVVGLGNRWTPFHRMSRWPRRLAALGDVVCSFNPVYGQGMTVAALEAEELGGLLSRSTDLDALGWRFQRRAARVLRLPWRMATSADLGWTATRSGPAARLVRWYLDRMIEVLPGDLAVYRRFFQVAQMVKGPSALFDPRVVAKVLAGPR